MRVLRIRMKWLTSMVTNRDLFPGKWGFAIFVAYMGLFINQGWDCNKYLELH